MALLSLTQLLDAAIGTPEAEAVNFRALRDLLQAMLGHLGLQDRSTRGLEQPAELDRARTPAAGQQAQQPGEQLPAKDPLQDTASGCEADAAADVRQPVESVGTDESSGSEVEALPSALRAPPLRRLLLQGWLFALGISFRAPAQSSARAGRAGCSPAGMGLCAGFHWGRVGGDQVPGLQGPCRGAHACPPPLLGAVCLPGSP